MQKTHTIYYGTRANSGDSGIYCGTLDGESGKLGEPKLVARAKNPSFLALSPDNRYLYAVLDLEGSAVGAWRISSQNGSSQSELEFLNHRNSGGEGACHLCVDASGKNVLVANYGGGNIACFPIGADGSLQDASATVQHFGSGPNAARQEKPHAHSIYCDESNTRVYVCDLGTDHVKIYAFDSALGALIPNHQPAASMPAGSGPRHLAFHPAGRVYVNHEMGLSITVCERDKSSGALQPIQTVSTLPPEAPKDGISNRGVTTAEIALHPAGKCLYVSNRGRDTIAHYSIGDDGKLTWIEESSTPAEPRSFAISPDGKWLVVAGQNQHQIAAFAIQSSGGHLRPIPQKIKLESATCVLFAPDNCK